MATNQIGFRGRNDDGSETTATWKASQNVNWTQTVDVNFRVRFLMQQSVVGINNLDVRLQYSLNGGTFTNVSDTSSVVRSSASPNVADAANLTQQLTGGTGTFNGATAFDEVNGVCGGNSLDINATGQFETEYSIQIRGVDVTHNDSIQLRTINNDTGTAWGTYTATPTITVDDPVPQTATPSPLTAVWSIVTPVVTNVGGTVGTRFRFSFDLFEDETLRAEQGINTAAQQRTPDALSITWITVTPATAIGGVNATPSPLTSTWAVATPSATRNDIVITGGVVTASWTVTQPTLTLGGLSRSPSPLTARWTGTGVFYVLQEDNVSKITHGSGFVLQENSIIVTEGGVSSAPNAVTATWAVVTPTATISSRSCTPSPLVSTWTLITPFASHGDQLATPDPVTTSWAVGEPTLTMGGVLAEPDAAPEMAATWSVPMPSLIGGSPAVGAVSPDSLVGSWSLFGGETTTLGPPPSFPIPAAVQIVAEVSVRATIEVAVTVLPYY